MNVRIDDGSAGPEERVVSVAGYREELHREMVRQLSRTGGRWSAKALRAREALAEFDGRYPKPTGEV